MKFLKHAENIDSLEKVQMYHISGINQQEDYNWKIKPSKHIFVNTELHSRDDSRV